MPRDLRTLPTWLPLHAPHTAPCRRQRPQPYEVETHSRSHSLLQSRASATVRPCGGGVRNSSSGCICEFAKCIERDRRGASVAAYALGYSCCRRCRLLLLYRLSHRLLLLLLLQTRLAIYTLCVQYTKQDRNAQCNVRNFFYDAFFLIFLVLILSCLTSSWVGTLFDFILRVVSKFTSVQIHVQYIRLSQVRFFDSYKNLKLAMGIL